MARRSDKCERLPIVKNKSKETRSVPCATSFYDYDTKVTYIWRPIPTASATAAETFVLEKVTRVSWLK